MTPDPAAPLARLHRLERHGVRMGLDAMRHLTGRLGHPERDLAFVHIAGTNGKGSTAALLESVLRAAGFSTGLYTSPHLVRFNERIRLNGEPASDDLLSRHLAVLDPLLDEDDPDRAPTFFDAATALALLVFREAKVDWVIWETGLGGRLDSTNIVTPRLSVITPIGLDHCEILGPTLADVAGEKAGIIKPGVPVVSAPQPPEAADVLQQAADAVNAPLFRCEPGEARLLEASLDGQRFLWQGVPWSLQLLGEHQLTNAATVLRAVSALRRQGVAVHEDAARAGLAAAVWTGRLQVLHHSPLTLLDGAHNPAGAAALAAFLKRTLADRPLRLVVGLLADKDHHGILKALLPLASLVHVVPVRSDRGLPPETLAAAACTLAPRLPIETFDSVASAMAAPPAIPDTVTVITGSLFLAGEVLAERA